MKIILYCQPIEIIRIANMVHFHVSTMAISMISIGWQNKIVSYCYLLVYEINIFFKTNELLKDGNGKNVYFESNKINTEFNHEAPSQRPKNMQEFHILNLQFKHQNWNPIINSCYRPPNN